MQGPRGFLRNVFIESLVSLKLSTYSSIVVDSPGITEMNVYIQRSYHDMNRSYDSQHRTFVSRKEEIRFEMYGARRGWGKFF